MDRCLVCRFVALLLSVLSLTQSSSITGGVAPRTDCIHGRIQCGRGLYYSPPHQGCCRGQGGHAVFDTRESICCGGNLFLKNGGINSCCGGHAIDKTQQICCAETSHSRFHWSSNGRMETYQQCCGAKPFDDRTHVCCETDHSSTKAWHRIDRLHGRKNYQCCDYRNGTVKVIDIAHETCPVFGICGGVMYNLDENICCNVITPTTPSAFKHRSITLNCTLQGNLTNGRSAQNVSFAFTNGEVQSKARTQVIDDRTVKLTIAGVSVNMSSSRISCRLGNETLDEVSIVVDDPRFPNADATECIVYNWERMTCTWDVEDTPNVSISMAYNRQTRRHFRCLSGGVKYICPKSIEERGGRGGCNWPAYSDDSRDWFNFMNHCIYFMAKNAYDAVAFDRPRRLIVDEIVKPNKVSSLELVNVTSNHIELRWPVHPSGRSVKYRVTYESRFSPTAVQNTSGTSIMLSNLIPNTNYTIEIDCIPLLRRKNNGAFGFWSDKETIHVATKSNE